MDPMTMGSSRPRSVPGAATTFSSNALCKPTKRVRGAGRSAPAFSMRPRLRKDVTLMHQSAGTQCQAAPPESEVSPFFEPLVRCFLLGVISGGLFESYSVLTTMADLSAHSANVWNTVKAVHAPDFVQDHVFAILLWCVLYVSESASLEPSDALHRSAVESFMADLPKTLLPLDFTSFKRFWLKVSGSTAEQMTAAASTAVLEAPPTMIGGTVTTQERSVGTDIIAEKASPFVEERAPRVGLKPGQWDPALGGIAAGKAANQAYMEGMYYCIGLVPTDGLKENKLHDASAMGTRLAYWKGADGVINTISSTCTHRGAQLVNGWIDEVNGKTCVRCPYHAWAFSGDGIVQDIPVQPEGGWPKRPLQQTFETEIQAGKLWLFWGRGQIPKEERPPVPGTADVDLDGMVSTNVSKFCEVPHHATMEALLSEDTLRTTARIFLGVTDCSLSAGEVESTWSSRTVNYTLTPEKKRPNPLLPGGLAGKPVQVRVSAQLPSSMVMTFDLGGSRCLCLEAHVHPEGYSTSRLTMTAHRNFSTWATSAPFVRDMLENVVEGQRGRAEGVPVKHVPDMNPFLPTRTNENGQLLHKLFTDLRVEFNNLGYGIPAEIAAAPHRVDM